MAQTNPKDKGGVRAALSDQALDVLLREARSHNGWQDRPVTSTQLQAIYDMAKMGPTSANCCPARYVFLTTSEARERIKPFLFGANVEKTMSAPAAVIMAHDLEFPETVPDLYPAVPEAKDWFTGSAEATRTHALRNGTLQHAYFMLAARALGLDCGPMGGIDYDGIDKEFFSGTSWRTNFVLALGYGDDAKLYERGPRPSFDDVCRMV